MTSDAVHVSDAAYAAWQTASTELALAQAKFKACVDPQAEAEAKVEYLTAAKKLRAALADLESTPTAGTA